MVKIGVIGTGYWGRNHVKTYKALLDSDEIDGLVICDADEKRASELARRFSVPFETDVERLLQDQSIDGVSIATPSPSHFELSKRLMEAGKDVLVEKPMTLDSTSAKELIKVSEDTGRILMVGHIFRHHPAVKELKERIDRGDLGRIINLSTNRFSYRVPRPDMGVLYALAIHEVDLYCHLMNCEYPKSIDAKLGRYVQDKTEEIALIQMEFEEGAMGFAYESWLTPTHGKLRDLAVIGTKMSARIDYLQPQELQLFDIGIAGEGDAMFVQDEGTFTIPIPYKEPLREELLDFIGCIMERRQPLSDMHSGARAVEMIEAAFESSREKRPVAFK